MIYDSAIRNRKIFPGLAKISLFTIQNIECTFLPTEVNNVFIQAKEILSVQDVILRSYEVDKAFGFDKTYVDLARALSKTTKGRNYK